LAFSGNAGSLVRLGERRRARISGAKRREGFFVASEVGELTPDTPLFWSRWPGRKGVRRMMPIHGKNIWRLCKTYGRMIGVPELKPHDLRHGVAMEVLEQQHDLEQVRALLGHKRIDTTQIYATIHPAQLKRAVAFYKAARLLSG
jgi:site-specific recombinase XerC